MLDRIFNPVSLRFLLLGGLGLINSFASAQIEVANEKTYKIDTITNRLTEAVDFDRPFYISIEYSYPVDPISVEYISHRKHKITKDAGQADTFAISKRGKKHVLLAHFNGIKPGRSYHLDVHRKQNEKESSDFLKLAIDLMNSSTSNAVVAHAMIDFLTRNSSLYVPRKERALRSLDSVTLASVTATGRVDYARAVRTRDTIRNEIDTARIARPIHLSNFSQSLYECQACGRDSLFVFQGEKDHNLIDNYKEKWCPNHRQSNHLHCHR
ncbi:hypothetical protein [Chryseolinea lacunae]|uniref:DUF3868 domain-containing protein n=1 Tax=Chryseolinea lacunae TaxID=2801331 RepID=A0ABS1KZH7_9BACT|nr:hypothetical protein [Chryseolinea lacunae]MBL0744871.1 hypothetical protein [Chryseolinea lacunae]